MSVSLTVNGKKRAFGGPAFTRLIDYLRETLRLTGTKEGCGEGECGACTVLVDGEPVNSCLIPVCSVAGAKVETVESLGTPEKLSKLQRGFLDCAGAQCGICTPGFLIAADALLQKHPQPTEEQTRFWLANNLCRCTGYDKIIRAVQAAAHEINANSGAAQ